MDESSEQGVFLFDGYVETTVDPGLSLIVATLIFGALLYSFLPCMVRLGNRSEKRNDEQGRDDTDTDADHVSAAATPSDKSRFAGPGRLNRSSLAAHEPRESFVPEEDGVSLSSSQHSKSNNSLASSVVNVVLEAALRTGSHSRGHGRQRMAAQKRAFVLGSLSEPPIIPIDLYDTQNDMASFNNNNSSSSSSSSAYYLPTIDHDDVSFHDAVDAHDPAYNNKGRTDMTEKAGDNRVCCGSAACWKPASIADSFDKLLEISEFEYETKRICKLAVPFVVQTCVAGLCKVTRMALIGRFLGTRELSAYLVVGLLLGLTSTVLSGLQDSLTALCSQAIEKNDNIQAVAYVRMSIVVAILFSLMNVGLWMVVLGQVLEWFGLDEDTVAIGKEFATLLLLRDFVRSVALMVQGLLYIVGLDMYCAIMSSLEQVSATVAVILATLLWESANLETVGLIYVICTSAVLSLNLIVIKWRCWLDEFQQGPVEYCTKLHLCAMGDLVKTTWGFLVARLLTHKQWAILATIARSLGPAEVVAWCILGTIWTSLSEIIGAVADASEARCAFLLVVGQPLRAQLSAFKSVFIGFVISTFIASCLLIAGEDMPVWITSDPTLQILVAGLIPLFSIGHVALAMSMMSWALVSSGSQERSRVATAIGLAGNWLVTIPLSVLFSIVLDISLQGQTAAVAVGYMVSNTLNMYPLLQSDWSKLSERAVARNATTNEANGPPLTPDPNQAVPSSSASMSSASSVTSSRVSLNSVSSICLRLPEPTPAASTSASTSTAIVPTTASVATTVVQGNLSWTHRLDCCTPQSIDTL